jgi:hypothetical protein
MWLDFGFTLDELSVFLVQRHRERERERERERGPDFAWSHLEEVAAKKLIEIANKFGEKSNEQRRRDRLVSA